MTKNNGLIYKTQDYLDHAKLLFTYTNRGKVTLVANGVKSFKNEYRSLAQYFTLIAFNDEEKSMFNLKEATLINAYETLKSDYSKLKDKAIILEIIDFLVTDDLPHDKIWHLAVDMLDIDNGEWIFAVKMMYIFGYGLDFIKDNPIGFNIENACVVGSGEPLTVNLNLEWTVLLSKLYFFKQEPIEIEMNALKQIKQFIKTFYKYHMDYELKSLLE